MSVILVNDYLFGMLGEEKVLWNYMLDNIDNLKGVDNDIIKNNNQYDYNLSFEENVSKYIKNNYPNCKLIIQNSLIGLIPINIKKIVLIQDNYRKMNINHGIQENCFLCADEVVTNSDEIDLYYNERKCVQIPLGIDNELFCNSNYNNKKDLRNILDLPTYNYNKFGIFVGCFNEVKGWKTMNDIINRRKDIFWILVTKFENDNFISNNSRVYNKINQGLLVKLLNASDFFILPSPSESQCLSAIEANLCNIPTIMRKTGYFTNLNQEEIDKVGIITDKFIDEDIDLIYKKSFSPREIILKKYSIQNMIEKWNNLIQKVIN